MFDNSVIKKTGQWWKAQLAYVTSVGGALVMLYGIYHGSLLLPTLGGLAAAIFGFVFACTAIRCPSCGSKWVWVAVSGQASNQWFPWLLSRSECPACAAQQGAPADGPASRARG